MPEAALHKVDFEPYFLRWNSVLHYPRPGLPRSQRQKIHNYTGEEGSVPCHQHKTCEALVWANVKYPPRVCPGCGVDTATEISPDTEMPTEVVLPPGVERE